MFADITSELKAAVPNLRGRLLGNFPLRDLTWLRAGGVAQTLFSPADEADLCAFLGGCPDRVPVCTIGVGSNLLVRDGGVPGVVIRLGRGFNNVLSDGRTRLRAGSAVLDVKLAEAAAIHCIAGLAFYRGIPGTVGGALRMNAGAHGGETCQFVREVRAVDRTGSVRVLDNEAMAFSYRSSGVPLDLIFIEAVFEGRPGERSEIEQEMLAVAAYRGANQPIKARTGGSTFKNPPGHSAWKLIDAAGCRGLRAGGAHMSEMHCNFIINDANATAADIEKLGETVRKRVLDCSGIVLEWEIKRIGLPASTGERFAAAE